MANPSDLIAHYSSHAFHTRIYALIFSGAVLGAVLSWNRAERESDLIGFALIVVVGCLSGLNWRYTHSYLAACRASSRDFGQPTVQEKEIARMQWAYFSRINEGPWSASGGSLYRFMPLAGVATEPSTKEKLAFGAEWLAAVVKKFFLSWSTYLPGLLVGILVIRRGARPWLKWGGLAIALLIFVVWLFLSARVLKPEGVEKPEGMKTSQ